MTEDEFDKAELLDVIEQLLDFSRYGSMHSCDGEDEAWERAQTVLARHQRGVYWFAAKTDNE